MLTRLRLTAITVLPNTTPGCAAASAITDVRKISRAGCEPSGGLTS